MLTKQTINEARTMANVQRRGETVKVSKMNAAPGTFFGSSCPCAFFLANGETCKHLIACEIETARWAAQEAEYDLREASDDDRYPEW